MKIYTEVPVKHKQERTSDPQVSKANGQLVVLQEYVVHGGGKTPEPIRKP